MRITAFVIAILCLLGPAHADTVDTEGLLPLPEPGGIEVFYGSWYPRSEAFALTVSEKLVTPFTISHTYRSSTRPTSIHRYKVLLEGDYFVMVAVLCFLAW